MFGFDLRPFFRGERPWTQLFRLLHQLPRTSRFHAALADDDERAHTMLMSSSDEARPSGPPLHTWTQEAELLAHIADLLAAQRADYAAVNSKSHRWRPPKPLPRPETAVDRARRRHDQHHHHDLVRKLIADSE